MTKAYVAMQLKKDITISALGIERLVKFDYLNGLLGVMMVFDSVDAAQDYSDNEILTVEIMEATS